MGFISACSALKRTLKSEEPREKFSDNYTIVDKLGEGSFAAVYSCCSKTAKNSGAVQAVKVTDTKRPDIDGARQDYRDEVKLLRLIGTNAHCVQLLDTFEERQFCYIVMERCACTVQEAFLRTDDLSEQDLAHVFRCMLSAVEHIHACGIVHRDIKPGNMLLANGTSLSGRPVVKLCDFGLSTVMPTATGKKRFGFLKNARGLTEICGTAPYMAPEMLRQKNPYGFGVDVWACGVSAYLMLFGEYPYATKGQRCSALMKSNICDGRVSPSYKACPDYPQPSDIACKFVAQLLKRNPEERPDATEALTSAFLTPARKAERSPSFHQTLLLARSAVEEMLPHAIPERPRGIEDQSTDCGSDDRLSTDTDCTISL